MLIDDITLKIKRRGGGGGGGGAGRGGGMGVARGGGGGPRPVLSRPAAAGAPALGYDINIQQHNKITQNKLHVAQSCRGNNDAVIEPRGDSVTQRERRFSQPFRPAPTVRYRRRMYAQKIDSIATVKQLLRTGESSSRHVYAGLVRRTYHPYTCARVDGAAYDLLATPIRT
ncbi:hypothetical protein RR48_12987 [Papilio machaon]|uniref:Uncharacterized protein n=1 Tax=Papilio machaon TaxID=76193 RepID=A0A194QRV3_PAPMA|nr:hypothetical protein RR48_12987 [Papilio machaon]